MSLDPNAVYIIFAVSFCYSLFSTFVSRKFGKPERIKEIQKTFSSLSKELKEASKSQNKAQMDEVIARQNAAMPMLWESMVLQMKPLIIILPVLFIIPGLMRDNFQNFIIQLPIHLPIFIQNFENFPNWRDTFGPVGWFWISVILCAILISVSIKAYEKFAQRKAE